MSGLNRERKAEPSLDNSLRRGRGHDRKHFPRPTDHNKDWQPHSVHSQSAVESDDRT